MIRSKKLNDEFKSYLASAFTAPLEHWPGHHIPAGLKIGDGGNRVPALRDFRGREFGHGRGGLNIAQVKNRNRRSSAGGERQTPKERILDVAEDLIAEHGPYGFRLQDVADRLKVKAPALYNHFQSRDELIAQVGVKLSRLSAARKFREPGEDAMTAARRRARYLVRFMNEHPAGARLVLWELAQSDSMSWPESTAIDEEQRAWSRKAFQQAVADGEFRDFRWELYASMLLGGLASLVLYPRFDKNSAPVSVETLQREADELVVRILTPDEPLNRLVQRLWEKESKNSD